MPFDPSLPAPNSTLSSLVMRNQLTGLKELIDAVGSVTSVMVDGVTTLPAGSPAGVSLSLIGSVLHFTFEIPQGQEGLAGPQGPAFSTAVVDSVNTLNPGEAATVGSTFDGTTVHFTFGIPRGSDGMNGSNGSDGSQGPQGSNGNDGAQGPPGNDGAQGPPFAQAVVDGVSTLNPGDSASVSVNFDGSNVRFQFGIPRGADGAAGTPGEVTNADLTAAISNAVSGTSNNSNAVSTLNQSADSNYNPSQIQALMDKMDELITALRR